MSTRLYWFSGTGNSLRLARALAEAFDDAELVPIAAAGAEPAEPPERVGLVFPVYAFGPPNIVARFIAERLPAGPETYIFAAMTYAGEPGPTALIVRKLLRARGLELSAAFGVRMPQNYPPMGGAPRTEKQQQILAKSEQQIAAAVAAARECPRGQINKGNLAVRWIGLIAYPLFHRGMAKADGKFSVDENCDHCGLCARICPVGDIEIVDGRPRWLGKCQQCYACFHWCPKGAIQRGRKTAEQVRYHHPDVKASDMTVRGGAAAGQEESET